jgi:hypothetical protein
LGLGFLTFSALILSLVSRMNSLARQAKRLLKAVENAEEIEKKLQAEASPPPTPTVKK